jgi:hypothetical protein
MSAARCCSLLLLSLLLTLAPSRVAAESSPAVVLPDAPPRHPILPIEGGALRNEVSLAFVFADAGDVYLLEATGAFALVASGRVSFWGWLELGLAVPLVASRGLPHVGGFMRSSEEGFGNIDVQLKLSLLRGPRHHLAVYLRGTLPTFVLFDDRSQSINQGGIQTGVIDEISHSELRPGLAYGRRSGRLSVQLDLSLRFEIDDRRDKEVTTFPGGTVIPPTQAPADVSTSLIAGAAVALRLASWLSLLGGTQLHIPFDDAQRFQADDLEQAPVHWLLFAGGRALLFGGAFLEVVARAAPLTFINARERFSFHAAIGFSFPRGML